MRRPAAVLGLRPAGLALARALGRSGVSVAGIATGSDDFGIASRYLARRVRVDEPDPRAREERLLAALTELASAARLVLFPELDQGVAFVLRHWEEVRELADVPLPDDPGLVRRLAAKDTLVEEAGRAGVPVPRTVAARTEDAVREADLTPPFLVKPVESEAYARRFARKLVRARSVEEAVAAWREADAAGFATVLQEEIPAHDRVFSLFTYVGRDGRQLASVVGRKIRQIPRGFGSATVFRVEPEPRVLDLGASLLSATGYRGFAHVELVHDLRDDSFRLLEVNTRVPVWGGIAMRDGWNVARLAYEDLVGERPEPLGVLEEDAVWLDGTKDAWVSAQMAWRRELGPRLAFAPYRAGRKARAVVARDDPRPALAFARWAAGAGAARAARRVSAIGALPRSSR